MSRIRHNLASCSRGCLTAVVGIFLALGLVYWGYCWGWWGHTNLTLQYLFQCQCPAASESARYRPYKVLASACQQPRVVDLSPSGRYFVFSTQVPTPTIWRYDLIHDQVAMLPINEAELNHIHQLDDHTLFVTRYKQHYRLFDLHDGSRTEIPWQFADQLNTRTWERVQGAERVIFFDLEILVLAPNYQQHPDHNLVIFTSSTQWQTEFKHQLTAAGIPYQPAPQPYTTGPVTEAQYSHDGRFWADPQGIALAQTDARIVTLHLPPLAQPANFRPFGWTPDNRAVVYAAVYAGGRMPHLIDWVYPGWKLFPVPQPILLVEVPEEYRE